MNDLDDSAREFLRMGRSLSETIRRFIRYYQNQGKPLPNQEPIYALHRSLILLDTVPACAKNIIDAVYDLERMTSQSVISSGGTDASR